MKITKQQLKQIIQEELKSLEEGIMPVVDQVADAANYWAAGDFPGGDAARARELEAGHGGAEDPSARMSRLEGDVLALKEEARVLRERTRVHRETLTNILDAMRNEEAPHG